VRHAGWWGDILTTRLWGAHDIEVQQWEVHFVIEDAQLLRRYSRKKLDEHLRAKSVPV
jgi:hypothetical protein